MKGLTDARLEVLKRCTSADGLKPMGPDWFAIYWLREHNLVKGVRTQLAEGLRPDHYFATTAGVEAVAGSKSTEERP